ncbi:MAG: hypothetical protein ACPHP7_09055 [Planctomycetota bacterium]
MTKFKSVIAVAMLFVLVGSPLGYAGDDETPFSSMLPESMGDVIEDTEAVLERMDGAVYIEAETEGLQPGHAYTVWAIVYNNPADCIGRCSMDDDLFHASTSVMWSGVGFIADDDGEAEFEAILVEGEAAGEILLGSGMTDAANAEVQLVVRGHGPASTDPLVRADQLSLFMGGCDLNDCIDEQMVSLGGPVILDEDSARFMDRDPENFGALIPKSRMRVEREDDRIEVNGKTRQLTPGYAYTIWAIVYNDPFACNGPCDGDDSGVYGRSVFWSGIGFIANNKGRASFETELIEGYLPGEVRTGSGLTDASMAEVHFVIRCHGPAATDDPELLEAQLTTFDGGCDLFGCVNVQSVMLCRLGGMGM